ncbi:hypothetical protein BKN38_03125 [Helicobacter sp. CLO-3]|uniref:ABC-type transport auxiliary lipoprotein family protein n=1 Tax=unclassified Helicobacter TaxID=2593540 RepID=UPI000805E2E1|nr:MULTISPECIES: ABC-type transport auxiliary lipoprotein family protein [unclassified Helicobacter]OBV29225.1 hypothetical protein BA723_06470 [Helicobacter sp. CLO-3]OHU84456.1 hypothetical protein BKN38_03125 [Helicobacter sp. CLO-3]
MKKINEAKNMRDKMRDFGAARACARGGALAFGRLDSGKLDSGGIFSVAFGGAFCRLFSVVFGRLFGAARALFYVLFYVLFCVLFSAMFAGCIDINLKSSAPKTTYYTLPNISSGGASQNANQGDSSQNASQSDSSQNICVKDIKTIKLNLDITSYLNTQNIYISHDDNAIQRLSNAQWIDLPTTLIQNALESKMLDSCIKLSTIGTHAYTLSIKIKDMTIYAAQNSSSAQNLSGARPYARASLDYTITQGSKHLQTRTINKQINASSIDSSASDKSAPESTQATMIKALQSALDSVLDEVRVQICNDIQGVCQ